MNSNEQLIHRFYSAFQRLDYKTMNACYSETIVFSDPVFLLLEGEEVRCMWEMLCKSARDFSLEFSTIRSIDEEYCTCEWTARYIFSKTGHRVTNKAKAFMRLRDGKIIEHSDGFRLSTWIGQALGWKGQLLGWTNFMKRKVQMQEKASLLAFINKKASTEGGPKGEIENDLH